MNATLELDKSGRVLIPKKLREALHLKAGEKLTAHLENGQLIVTPEPRAAHLLEVNGWLMADLPDGAKMTGDPVEDMRAARDRDILGEW